MFASSYHQNVWKRSGKKYNSECLHPSAKKTNNKNKMVETLWLLFSQCQDRWENVNAEKCCQILIHRAIHSGKQLIGTDFFA